MKYFKIHIDLNKVRCLTIGQFEAAEATIAENGSLFYVMNVTETKRKESCLTLTCRRKQQVQKFMEMLLEKEINLAVGIRQLQLPMQQYVSLEYLKRF